MKYLTTKLINNINQTNDINQQYPDELKDIHITIKGTRNLFDIYFCVDDVEHSFNFTIAESIEYIWITNETGKSDKYITYPMLKRALFSIKDNNRLADTYLHWVDSLIFSSNKSKPFFKSLSSNTTTEDEATSIRSSISSSSVELNETNQYMIVSLNHKIQSLEHALEVKDKDIQILERDVEIRNKEIELLRLQISILNKSDWC